MILSLALTYALHLTPIKRDVTLTVSHQSTSIIGEGPGAIVTNDEAFFTIPGTIEWDPEGDSLLVYSKPQQPTAMGFMERTRTHMGTSGGRPDRAQVTETISHAKSVTLEWTFETINDEYVGTVNDFTLHGSNSIERSGNTDSLEPRTETRDEIERWLFYPGSNPWTSKRIAFSRPSIKSFMTGKSDTGQITSNATLAGTAGVSINGNMRVVIDLGKFDCPGQVSGGQWCGRYPDSKQTGSLSATFRPRVEKFIEALREAGAQVTIGSCYRPRERAYLMTYAWKVAREDYDPTQVHPFNGIDICWSHAKGRRIDYESAKRAAEDMVQGYHMAFHAVEDSAHTAREAVDMTITWNGDLKVKDAEGREVLISSEPRTGGIGVDSAQNPYPADHPLRIGNTELHRVGKTYGVIKLVGDAPHWSSTGK